MGEKWEKESGARIEEPGESADHNGGARLPNDRIGEAKYRVVLVGVVSLGH
jgi:hypothetical protein